MLVLEVLVDISRYFTNLKPPHKISHCIIYLLRFNQFL